MVYVRVNAILKTNSDYYLKFINQSIFVRENLGVFCDVETAFYYI